MSDETCAVCRKTPRPEIGFVGTGNRYHCSPECHAKWERGERVGCVLGVVAWVIVIAAAAKFFGPSLYELWQLAEGAWHEHDRTSWVEDCAKHSEIVDCERRYKQLHQR